MDSCWTSANLRDEWMDRSNWRMASRTWKGKEFRIDSITRKQPELPRYTWDQVWANFVRSSSLVVPSIWHVMHQQHQRPLHRYFATLPSDSIGNHCEHWDYDDFVLHLNCLFVSLLDKHWVGSKVNRIEIWKYLSTMDSMLTVVGVDNGVGEDDYCYRSNDYYWPVWKTWISSRIVAWIGGWSSYLDHWTCQSWIEQALCWIKTHKKWWSKLWFPEFQYQSTESSSKFLQQKKHFNKKFDQ